MFSMVLFVFVYYICITAGKVNLTLVSIIDDCPIM
jgi:hypothetical protein